MEVVIGKSLVKSRPFWFSGITSSVIGKRFGSEGPLFSADEFIFGRKGMVGISMDGPQRGKREKRKPVRKTDKPTW
jgi:hypothetical protein